ncbi:hematopoietic progenitor cell antigen CD34 isoform X2 [Hippoglossus stenolepis]|uniref:hematopoietic progenitor cell antigen CD34 isoform X2 n=1 Tax=Hippoglossus stenolepis TaxID=195615 RepID=UPI001FB03EE9|nr:hematopoietic progenitor cell antigen CD34 isoform X2 [Hippoglossus stenolepis]
MAASSAKRNEEPRKMLALALLLVASLLNAGVMAQDEEIVAATAPSLEAPVRGDMIPLTTPEPEDPQVVVFPTVGPLQPTEKTTAATDEAGNAVNSSPAAPGEEAGEGTQTTAQAHTDKPKAEDADTPAPMPSRGDGPRNVPGLAPNDDVVCVTKEAVQNKNAVSLKLKASSNCKDTKQKIESVVQELCGEDCKLELYQEDNTDEILVSGKYVEDDLAGMANKFNNDNIKDKVDVEEALPRWGKNSKLVLVSLLLTGLLLAAVLMAGYYFKTHRKNSKGVRLAESFQVDEENQANTLVSVAPLPQEPFDKPTPNGESPPENGINPTPTTNGHSQTPVADTEM